ncbi:MAG: hypothetical protein GXX85_05510 [Ignavibacteria bacterium]|nr:hypothetical protein [Ignavibacteria bacterium]
MLENKKKQNASTIRIIIYILIFSVLIFFTTGIFVVQPIGALPEGATIVYWRFGTSMPYITSADGMLSKSGAGVSLLGRGIALGSLLGNIKDKQIISLPYSQPAVFEFMSLFRKTINYILCS